MYFNRYFHIGANCLLLLLLGTVFSLNVIAKDLDFGNYHALLIGNQYYKHQKEWKNLSTPHADVDALAYVLKHDFGFNTRVEKDQNRGQIVDLLEDYKNKLSPRDNLLIYYAGHGHLRQDGGYWIGVEGKKNSRSDWIKYTTISDLLDKNAGMEAKHVLVIADSCYAGAAYRNENFSIKREVDESEAQWIERMVQKRVRKILSSGGEQPVVDQLGNNRHSVFANTLLDQLKQIAREKEIKLTYDLFSSIGPDVHHRTMRYLNDAQAPDYKKIPGTGDQGGDFVFKPLLSQGVWVEDEISALKSPLSTRDQSVYQGKPKTTVLSSRIVRALVLDSHIYKPSDILKLRILTNSSRIRSFALFELIDGKIERVEAKCSKADGIHLKYKIPDNVTRGEYSFEIFVQELGNSEEERHKINFSIVR